MIYKGIIGYLYQGSTVVVNKKDIHGAKEDDFEEVRIILNEQDVCSWAKEFEMMKDDSNYDENV